MCSHSLLESRGGPDSQTGASRFWYLFKSIFRSDSYLIEVWFDLFFIVIFGIICPFTIVLCYDFSNFVEPSKLGTDVHLYCCIYYNSSINRLF